MRCPLHLISGFAVPVNSPPSYKLDQGSDPWCGPIHKRAARALAEGRTNPLAEDMSETHGAPETTSALYICHTQRGRLPTLGVAPQTPRQNGNFDSIVLGIGPIIPRWDVHQQPNRKLQYFVQKTTFPSDDTAQIAASTFQQAADEWNNLAIGLSIVPTNDQATANFYLVYKKLNDPTDPTLAVSFFPNEKDQDVVVYSTALQPNNRMILKNIFLHELGHVLGLRHEFAITGDSSKGLGPEGDGAVQFMTANYNSVMSYNFPPTIQQTDKDGIQAFYKLQNGSKITDSQVTDYVPLIRNAVVQN